PGESRATRATRGAVLAFAALVATETALGLAGWLTAGATLAVLAVAAALAVGLARRRARGPADDPRQAEPATALEAGLAGALVAALRMRIWPGLHAPTFLSDALSYHLHAPLIWMHDRRLEIVPSPFGDPAPAYAPANLELWFLFLMAPLRSDVLAGVGQLPF